MSDAYKLLDVCDFQGGTQPPKDEWRKEPADGYVRMLQIRDYSQDSEKYAEYVKDTKKLHKCKKEDIMLSRYGYIGQAFMGLEGAYNVALVKVIKLREIETKYLLYYFKSKSFQHYLLENVGARATIPGFNKSELKDATIRIPSRNEQLYIVGILEKTEGIIEDRRKELQKLDELVKARFVEMFEMEKRSDQTIEELCSKIVDCPHTTPKYEGELKHPAIRTSEIKKGFLTWDTMKYVSDDEYEERVSRLRPDAGDIVYGREGTLGNAAVLPDGYKFCLGQRVMLLRPDYSICTSEYLLYAIISDGVYEQALKKNRTSTVSHINIKDIKKFVVPVASIESQQKFSAFVKQIDKSKFVAQKALDEAQLLFDNLMQKYFE